jgi:hypothetical protein
VFETWTPTVTALAGTWGFGHADGIIRVTGWTWAPLGGGPVQWHKMGAIEAPTTRGPPPE